MNEVVTDMIKYFIKTGIAIAADPIMYIHRKSSHADTTNVMRIQYTYVLNWRTINILPERTHFVWYHFQDYQYILALH